MELTPEGFLEATGVDADSCGSGSGYSFMQERDSCNENIDTICQDSTEPVECPPLCRMYCENGYVQDENGCDTCECITDITVEVEVCPEGCTSWFDGCNTCGCEGGEVSFCTEMFCVRPEEPYCMAYEEVEEPSCADDGMCCPVGYTCMRPRGGRPGEMQCVGIADGTAPAMECEEPCLMVDCLPGCDLVGSDENGCGGTCECAEDECALTMCHMAVCNNGEAAPVPEGECCGDLTLCEDEVVTYCSGMQGDHACVCESGVKYSMPAIESSMEPSPEPLFGRRNMAIYGEEMYCSRENSCIHDNGYYDNNMGMVGPISMAND